LLPGEQSSTCCSLCDEPLQKSTTSTAENAQQLPHWPWFFTAGMRARQSTE
jgi:hypothetical protein